MGIYSGSSVVPRIKGTIFWIIENRVYELLSAHMSWCEENTGTVHHLMHWYLLLTIAWLRIVSDNYSRESGISGFPESVVIETSVMLFGILQLTRSSFVWDDRFTVSANIVMIINCDNISIKKGRRRISVNFLMIIVTMLVGLLQSNAIIFYIL